MLDLTLESMNLLSVDINMLKFATIIVADFSMLSYHTGAVSYLLHVFLPYWCSESVLRAILVRNLIHTSQEFDPWVSGKAGPV